jgi:hypothetical protein
MSEQWFFYHLMRLADIISLWSIVANDNLSLSPCSSVPCYLHLLHMFRIKVLIWTINYCFHIKLSNYQIAWTSFSFSSME